MPKILITGATGFLGSHIVNLFAQQMPQAVLLGTTKSLQNAEKIEQFRHCLGDKVELREADMY